MVVPGRVQDQFADQLTGVAVDHPDVQVVDGGTLSFTLAPLIGEAERLIVIDAAQLLAPAGTVCTFLDQAFDEFLGSAKLTVHEVSLVDLFDIARLTEDPDRYWSTRGALPWN